MMNEEMNGGVVHEIAFGKGGGLTSETPDSLAQGAIEAFNVIGRPVDWALLQRLGRNNAGISLPDVGKAVSGFVGLRNPAPEDTAGFHSSASQSKGYNLSGATA